MKKIKIHYCNEDILYSSVSHIKHFNKMSEFNNFFKESLIKIINFDLTLGSDFYTLYFPVADFSMVIYLRDTYNITIIKIENGLFDRLTKKIIVYDNDIKYESNNVLALEKNIFSNICMSITKRDKWDYDKVLLKNYKGNKKIFSKKIKNLINKLNEDPDFWLDKDIEEYIYDRV